MKKQTIPIILLIFLMGCSHPIQNAIKASDNWWRSFRTEDANYYKQTDLGKVVFHLCGSRAKLSVEYNKRYLKTPFDLQSNVYMLTCSGDPVHVWLVVKVRDGKILLHKWATGHEMVRVLSLLTDISLENADDYR